jgi:hypothetical protein
MPTFFFTTREKFYETTHYFVVNYLEKILYALTILIISKLFNKFILIILAGLTAYLYLTESLPIYLGNLEINLNEILYTFGVIVVGHYVLDRYI